MPAFESPVDLARPVAELIRELGDRLGVEAAVQECCELLGGGPREDHLDALPYLTGFSFAEGSPARDPATWRDYWVRTWGGRGLLHLWDDVATPSIVAGLADEHWRPAEMCLKVAAKRDLGPAGPGAAALAEHRMARVRVNAVRTLGFVGDTEHVVVVQGLLQDPEPAVRRAAAVALERMVSRLDLA